MPTNKNASLRYQVLDRCFSDFHRKYEISDLLDKVNDALMDLYGTEVSIRQIRDDIKYMRDRVTYNAPIKAYQYDGKKCYYRYEDRDFSIILLFDKQPNLHPNPRIKEKYPYFAKYKKI